MTYILTDIFSKPLHHYSLIHNFKLWTHFLFISENVLKVPAGEIELKIQHSETSQPLR